MLHQEAHLLEAQRLLTLWFHAPDSAFQKVRSTSSGQEPDLIIEHEGARFIVKYKSAADAAIVGRTILQAKQYADGLGPSAIPIVAVPRMGRVGKRLCEEANVGWFDLSGNAHIIGPGLRIIIEGKPNRFQRRASTAFAPKGSRVSRVLLMHPDRVFLQRELCRETGLSEGSVSKIVQRLSADRLVTRLADGSIRARDPDLLLEAWREVYRFSRHRVVKGHVTARSGDALARFVADTLVAEKSEYAVTGLAAAWQLTHFAAFRIATFFLHDEPSAELKEKLGFHEDPRGANLWLVVPNDEGVFKGARELGGLHCVHPVQAYLDLKEHPERSAEAADRLRAEFLNWKGPKSMEKNLFPSPKNAEVWKHAQSTGLIVEVDTGSGAVLSGTVRGLGTSVVSDRMGRPARTVILETDRSENEVAESARILSYGSATWRNLVAGHVFAAAEEAATAQGRGLNSHFAAAATNVLIGDEHSVDANKKTLPNALSENQAPAERADFVLKLVTRLGERLAPFYPEEVDLAAALVAEAFGGDEGTYALQIRGRY